MNDMFWFVLGIVVVVLVVVLMALFIAGYICAVIAISHSLKKRVVRGEDYSAGAYFIYTLGWGAACACTSGLATLIYYFVKRNEIRATRDHHAQLIQSVAQQRI